MGLFSRKSPAASKINTELASPLSPSKRNQAAGLKSPLYTNTISSDSYATFPNPSDPIVPLATRPDPNLDPAAYLQSIYSVRDRTSLIYAKAKTDQLQHFDVDQNKFRETAEYLVSIIKRDHAPNYAAIPPYGRWQQFESGGRARITDLLACWPSSVDNQERTRRLIDLFLISVLLDTGAGPRWAYKSKESGRMYRRSEGLAIASLEMFKAGCFSSQPTEYPHRVDAKGLRRFSECSQSSSGPNMLDLWMQISETNPLPGMDGRRTLFSRLSSALAANSTYFGQQGRPGMILDHLLSHPTTMASSVPIITVPTLWSVLVDGLSSIWPSSTRTTTIDGIPLGDAWPCRSMPASPPALPWESIVPLHRLTQWLCYSLMAPMTRIMKVHFAGVELLTGLPDHRNGGLLIDTGLLTLKPAEAERGYEAFKARTVSGQTNVEVVPLFNANDDVVIEWRAVTVGYLDDLLYAVNEILQASDRVALTMAQFLEAGSWKGGRELAEVSRPNNKEPPIIIVADEIAF